MGQRADHRQFVGYLGRFRQQLTELHTRKFGLNCLQLTTIFDRGKRLRIPRLLRRQAAIEKDVNDALRGCLGSDERVGRCLRRLDREKVG